jgi:hypothetical protein
LAGNGTVEEALVARVQELTARLGDLLRALVREVDAPVEQSA